MERLTVITNHITPLVKNYTYTASNLIELSRPKALNALVFEMIYNIIQTLENSKKSRKPVVITGMHKKFFASGGDLKLVTERYLEVAEYLRSLYHMFYLASLLESSTSLWTGYIMGGGAGLGCSCKIRVAFPSTRYSMPENKIGLYPNVGGSYFLSHLVPKSFGLYISMTGAMISGLDCYVLGLCNYFIKDEDYFNLLEDLKHNHPETVIKKYHYTPDKCNLHTALSNLWKNRHSIEDCFHDCKSVEEIIQTLETKNTDWSRKTLEELHSVCPLSLKVIKNQIPFEAFRRASALSLKESFEMEYRVDYAMMVTYRYNFLSGVNAQFKKKTFSDWVPAEISQVTREFINEIFENSFGLKIDLSFLT